MAPKKGVCRLCVGVGACVVFLGMLMLWRSGLRKRPGEGRGAKLSIGRGLSCCGTVGRKSLTLSYGRTFAISCGLPDVWN